MESSFVRLFLVRHAEAVANAEFRYLGNRDDPLTERGRRQVDRLAAALATVPIAAVYASPYRRARDTAVPIAAACGVDLVTDARLGEGGFGAWEGLTRDEVIARGPADAELHARWEVDPSCAPPGGESFATIQERVTACVRDLLETSAGRSVVLVSHVGPIKALLCAALGAPLTAAQRIFLDSATISVVDWGPDAAPWGAPAVVRLVNAPHLLGSDAARWLHG